MSARQRQLLAAAARGMLVTPWLAAGAGFVLAAGALIFAPHAQLHFGGAIQATPCRPGGCGSPSSPGVPPAEAGVGDTPVGGPPASGGTRALPPRPSGPAGPASPAAGVTVSYDTLFGDGSGFEMLITVRGQHQLGPWQLAFAIPGGGSLSVPGARWQSEEPGGGIAGGTVPGHRKAQFVVRGTGRAAPPSHCEYNGTLCRFIEG